MLTRHTRTEGFHFPKRKLIMSKLSLKESKLLFRSVLIDKPVVINSVLKEVKRVNYGWKITGNGLFLFGMARRIKDMNFLGLELNAKLVDRCFDEIHQLGIQNVHFLATNATSTFGSIVSSYPGALVLVSIQCPNPDFNKPDSRWRMLQRSLVEAIADRLVIGGKVFLQSDIEAVSLRMKKEFIEHSKGKIALANYDEEMTNRGQWLKENPFGVPSDWEQHVLDRGDPMYRLLLAKVTS